MDLNSSLYQVAYWYLEEAKRPGWKTRPFYAVYPLFIILIYQVVRVTTAWQKQNTNIDLLYGCTGLYPVSDFTTEFSVCSRLSDLSFSFWVLLNQLLRFVVSHKRILRHGLHGSSNLLCVRVDVCMNEDEVNLLIRTVDFSSVSLQKQDNRGQIFTVLPCVEKVCESQKSNLDQRTK